MKIVAFPFAGGNKHSFSFLRKYIPKSIELIVLEYPGRGGRMDELLMYDIEGIVEDAFNKIKKHIDSDDYVIYGHSMGAIVASLLCKKIERERLKNPLKLIVSGRSAPSIERKKGKISYLPSNKFWNEVVSLNGIPSGFMEEPALMKLFEPILRADFQTVEEYTYQGNFELNLPIDVFYGDEEIEDSNDMNGWLLESKKIVNIYELKGDHFFIYNHGTTITRHLTAEFFQLQ